MFRKLFAPLAFSLVLIASGKIAAQTNCETLHPKTGVFICYPNPAVNPADTDIPENFHFSAQVNPAPGQTVRRYSIVMDGRILYESRLPAPLKKLSIETNLKLPVHTKSHDLHLMVYGLGSAEVNGLRTRETSDSMLCDPFSRTDPRACNLSKPPTPLRWQAPADTGAQHDMAGAYTAALHTYGRNLKRLEADASDAVTVDGHGNLFTASHVLSDVEVRKYSPDGAIIYDALVRSCGDGFVQVSGMAATDSGLVWIAANTNACFKSSSGAVDARAERSDRMRGILILVDTTQAGSIAPAYLGRLAASEYRVTAIRTDREGNAYVAGAAGSADFPHGEVLDTDTHARASDKGDLGFAAAISKSGSALWSCLLRNIFPAAISVGENGNVVVAGRGADGAALAEIADRGRRLSTLVRSAGAEEFRAVSMTPNGEWALVAGVAATRNASSQHEQETFFAAVPVCRTDRFNAHPLPQSASEEAPGIALGAALDSLAAAWLEKSPAPCRPLI